MIEWTEPARRVLNEYCAQSKSVLAGSGADAEEVSEDLRRHVEEEVRAARLSVVTENDVRRILARLGDPKGSVHQTADRPPEQKTAVNPSDKKRPGFILFIMGVFLPACALIFELVTGLSAGVLFDPMPTWFHVAALALVPVANFWIWRAGRARDPRHAQLLGWLNGAALGISIYYLILYFLFTPIAAIGLICFGLGLLPLSPHLAVIATPMLRKKYRERVGVEQLPGRWATLAAFGVLLLLQLPSALTYYGLNLATSEDAESRIHGVRVLRTVGDDELLLRACYGLLRRELDFDLVRGLASGGRNVTADEAREVYFRVTGRPFNSVRPPSLYTRSGRWTAVDQEFTWDDALGGEAVAGRVKGLSLLSSRMDAIAEPDAAVTYCEWTLEFKNVATQQREARAQIALPPGGVVSRLTLWVDGEEREAAFGGRSQVREAYRDVAVARRQDPVLVTTCGPDRVLVQCFPVPANGGVMKVRLGITAPLILESLQQGQFVWPHFLERNFAIAPELKHALWIESPGPLADSHGSAATNANPQRPFALQSAATDDHFHKAAQTVTVARSAEVKSVWTPIGETGAAVRQVIQPAAGGVPSRIVFVIDGSIGMKQYLAEVREALTNVPEAAEISMIVAGDKPQELIKQPEKATAAVLADLRRALGKVQCVGGQDNVPALEVAWDLAARSASGVVIWIHPPQPVLLSAESGLLQRIERSPGGIQLLEIQTENGPDRVVEKLDGFSSVRHATRFGSLSSDLDNLFGVWTGKRSRFELVRERLETFSENAGVPRASKHIERLWAKDEVHRLASHRNREAAMKLAAENQLVTPVSGAVVLETQQQFEQHNLKAVDPKTVPSVPEPQPLALVGVGILAYALYRFTKRRKQSAMT